jgi:hypothetical protein
MEKLSPDQPNPSSGDENPVAEILALLGDVVLVPVHPLTKKPIGKSWQQRTRESMQDQSYLRSFAGKNIGVLLGRASGGLGTIDIDLDADVEPFLADNPRLRDTTRTKRVRGCNFWIYIDGDYPKSTPLKIGNRVIGEWRADGNQTLIHGAAIDKRKGETEPTRYRFLNRVSPIRLKFSEIAWPEGCTLKSNATHTPIRLNPVSCITTSLHNCIPASLHNNKADLVLTNIKARREALDALESKHPNHPNFTKLYTGLIEPRFQAQAHARNGFIVQAVTFLYRCVAPQFVLELVGFFYDCNRALFNDPREQHMKEAKAMLESVAKTYAESLSTNERVIYEALPEYERDAFRICRDLALLPGPEREPLTFFLSFDHLGARLGVFAMQAQRIMRQLEGYGLIKQVKKGTRRAPGVRGEAGTYRWQLPPAQPNQPKP